MQIELNEEIIKQAFEEELTKSIHRVIKEIVNRWGFDSKIKSLVDPIIEESIAKIAREEVENIDKLREEVRIKIAQKINRQLQAIMKEADL